MIKTLDFIGIGFGPANIALAIQLQENNLEDKLDYLFIDNNKDSLWQREMLISGSDIQNVPVRDLITPINPQSYYSFINYLHKNNRYFSYFGTGLTYPLRKDYAMYINWCASHFNNRVHYQETVIHLDISECGSYYIVTTNLQTYHAKMVIMATGRSLFIPEVLNNIPNSKLITINDFISKTSGLDREKEYKFAVIGASQSAAEVFLDLADKFYNSKIHSYIRNFSFVARDSSPFSFEVFFPEFINEYYNADDQAKMLLNNHLRRSNYSSADLDILDKINIKMYEESLDNHNRIEIRKNSTILEASNNGKNISIKSRNKVTNTEHIIDYDFIIACTGFRDLGQGDNKEYLPPLLDRLSDKLIVDKDKGLMNGYISENYELFFDEASNPIYLNGLCETSHGMGDSGSFGLISVRANRIMNSLIKHIEK